MSRIRNLAFGLHGYRFGFAVVLVGIAAVWLLTGCTLIDVSTEEHGMRHRRFALGIPFSIREIEVRPSPVEYVPVEPRYSK